MLLQNGVFDGERSAPKGKSSRQSIKKSAYQSSRRFPQKCGYLGLSPLPPGLIQRLADRAEQVLDNPPRPRLDLRLDGHARLHPVA